ncbi:MAG: hypothetical protein UFG06_14645 [Lachnospiraceae bacterium]|nr:hypothetical protein [Lachnospiraceae bacterium]
MNSMIFSFLTFLLFIFHLLAHSCSRKGKIKESFCAVWCMDAVFSILGTIISYYLYQYSLRPFLSLRNLLLVFAYLAVTVLFFLLAPSGILLIYKKSASSEEETLSAEYRFHETAGLVRNFFLVLLFILPLLFTFFKEGQLPFLPASWRETEICGGFCFAAFLLLLPLSLRQAVFWLKNLAKPVSEAEGKLLQKYSADLHYRKKNRFL